MYPVEASGGVFDPVEAENGAEAVEFGTDVGVADQLRGACADEEKVFEEQ